MDVVRGRSITSTFAADSPLQDRFVALDSIRGIAAFIVVLGHLLLLWPEAERLHMPFWIRVSPLRILVNGHASVILFFVLSGYVLSMPYLRGERFKYANFLIRRVTRIYIPFAVAILLAAVLYSCSFPARSEYGSQWFHTEWGGQELTWKMIGYHLAMTGISNEMWLDGAMWSLVVELRISLIFPLLFALSRSTRCFVVAACSIYFSTTAIIVSEGWPLQTGDSLAGTVVVTLRFIPFFMLGVWLAAHNDRILVVIERCSSLRLIGLAVLASSTFYFPTEVYNLENLGNGGAIMSAGVLRCVMRYAIDILLGAGCGLLIVLVRNRGSNIRILNQTAVRELGKISYSLYLVHLPVLFVLFRLLLGKMPFIIICILGLLVSVLVAAFFYSMVERPSMRFGKYLTAKRRAVVIGR